MPDIQTLLIVIPALPLAAMLVTALLGKWVLGGQSHWPTVLALAGSCVASLALVFAVEREAQQAPADASRGVGFERVVTLWRWADIADAYRPHIPSAAAQGAVQPSTTGPLVSHEPHTKSFRIDITLRADPLTAIMLAMVTFVSLLVAVYSIGYMHGEPGYWRFFTYIALFVFSMTMLVSVSNFVLLYVFWEAVGLCSYLLIGFWYEKPAAAAAGTKAFLVNRVGDFGFALGVFLLWITYGTLDFHDTVVDGTTVYGILGQTRLKDPTMFVGGGLATAICLLLMLGACGKSAQFPLHVWLPDAMEGPTPVSALIHAATMVTAGVYMVTRCTPLFLASADARHVVAMIGGGTALMAAIIALSQTDLKRILAYSTISQLGYMFLGLGVGSLLGITSGMFHLVTHAFFKALLFLGAGSVMHAMGGVIDVRQFGGLRRRMPITHWTFLFGCLALAGVAPFSGFWSKDAILVAVREQASVGDARQLYWILYLVGSATAFLTAVYTFRAFFLTFYGPEVIPAQAGKHAHESPAAMTGPLILLALGAIGAGAYFQWTGDFTGEHGLLLATPSLAYSGMQHVEAEPGIHEAVALTSTVLAVGGVVLAALMYLGRQSLVSGLARLMEVSGLLWLSRGKFFFDAIYRGVVVAPLAGFARLLAWGDGHVVDAAVDGTGRLAAGVGAVLRILQSGLVQFYALAMVLGLMALVGIVLMLM